MDSHEGTYTKKFSARVEATFPGIVELDQTAFYHLGGGQPADCGVLNWDGGKALVNDVRKKNRIRHFTEGDSPEIGELVEAVEQDSNKIHEAADVIYHLMVYLEANNIKIEDVMSELKKRQK